MNYDYENKIVLTDTDEKKTSQAKKNLVIICNPNGSPLEHVCKSLKLDEMYLSHDIDVLMWNYRGYGFSKGWSTIDNLLKDAEAVMEFVKNKNSWNKIAIHGLSIGGVPSTHLAGKNLTHLIIADRTFSEIDEIVNTHYFGKILTFLYKAFLFPKSNNVESILNSNNTKIIIYDPLDPVVKDAASLKTGISYKVLKMLSSKYENEFKAFNKFNLKSMSILDLILPQNEVNEFVNSLLTVFNFMKDLEESIKKKKKAVTHKRNSGSDALLLENKNKQYVNVKDTNSNQIDIETDFESQINSEEKLESFINELYSILSVFESAGDIFTTLKMFSIKHQRARKTFIHNFYSNMFIWGCLKTDDEDFDGCLMCHKEIKNRFDELIENLSNLIKYNDIGQIKTAAEIYMDAQTILNTSIKLNQIFSTLLFKGNQIGDEFGHLNDLELIKEIESLNLGSLIPVTCGHNGNLSESELHIMKYELVKAKFI
jgi:hypothetical protein